MGTDGTGNRNCPACGRPIPWGAEVCPYCGHNFKGVVAAAGAQKQTYMPMIAGILIVLAGIHELYYGGVMIAAGNEALPITLGLSGFVVVCGVLMLFLGVFAVLGGVFAFQRKKFNLAVVGAVLAILGAYIIVPLIGLVLLLVSKDEFKD